MFDYRFSKLLHNKSKFLQNNILLSSQSTQDSVFIAKKAKIHVFFNNYFKQGLATEMESKSVSPKIVQLLWFTILLLAIIKIISLS